MSIGQQIVSPLPVVGVDTDGASKLDTFLRELRDCVEARCTAAGLDISGSLELQGSTLSNVGVMRMILAGDPGLARSFYVGSDGELYFRDGANNQIKFTATGSINVGTIAGFFGDYAGSSAQASYSSADARFSYTSAPGIYAQSETGDLLIHRSSDANYVMLRAPALQAADYTLTLPDSTPQGIGLVTMDATGTLNVRLSSSFTESIDVAHGIGSSGTPTYSTSGWLLDAAAEAVDFPFRLDFGDRIDSVGWGTQGVSTTGTLWFRSSGGNQAVIARVCINGGGVGMKTMQNGTATMTGTLPYTPPSTGSLFLRVECGNGGVDSVALVQVVKRRTMLPGG